MELRPWNREDDRRLKKWLAVGRYGAHVPGEYEYGAWVDGELVCYMAMTVPGPGTGIVSFLPRPGVDELQPLIRAGMSKARELGARIVMTFLARGNARCQEAAAGAGFDELPHVVYMATLEDDGGH